MALVDSLIGSQDPNGTPGAQISMQPEQPEAPADLPVEEVAALPPVKAVIEGQPPAVYVPEGTRNPMTDILTANFPKLGELNLSIYKSLDKKIVLFNPEKLPAETLQQADKAGNLDSVAAPLDAILNAPAPGEGEQAPASPAPQPMTPGITPRAQSKLAGKRIASLMEKSPTDRPVAGGGRILNSLLQRAV